MAYNKNAIGRKDNGKTIHTNPHPYENSVPPPPPPPPPVSLCCCQLNSKYRMKAILFFSNKFHFPRKRPGALPLVFTNFKLEHPTQSQYKVLSILKHHPDLLLMTLQIRGNTANIPALLRQYLLDSLIAIFCQLA